MTIPLACARSLFKRSDIPALLIFGLRTAVEHGELGAVAFAFSVVRVVMDIFINQSASKLEAFLLIFCFVFAEVRNSGGFCTCARVLLLRWS